MSAPFYMTDDFLKSIDPKVSPKHSPNLHRWLKRRMRVHAALSVWKNAQRLYIGYVDQGDIMGSGLMDVLTQGSRTQVFCFAGLAEKARRLPRFWSHYQKLGRCHIDPEHRMSFIDERWETTGDRRTCLWCGLVQRKRRWTERVRREEWVTP